MSGGEEHGEATRGKERDVFMNDDKEKTIDATMRHQEAMIRRHGSTYVSLFYVLREFSHDLHVFDRRHLLLDQRRHVHVPALHALKYPSAADPCGDGVQADRG